MTAPRFWIGVATGAFVAWGVTADHYGHIMRGDELAGILCRVHGMSGVRYGPFHDTVMMCVDMSDAVPEAELWEALRSRAVRAAREGR